MLKAATLSGQSQKGPRGVTTAPRLASASARWSKLQTVAAQLEELAFQLGPGTQLPRVSDLCSQFGASITTVNAALGDLEARGILQRRPGVGNFVAPDLHRANILLLCDASLLSRPELSPFWAMLIQGAQGRANTDSLGFDLQFAEPTFGRQTDGPPELSEQVSRLIENGRVDGVIAIGLERPIMGILERCGFPVVSFAGPASYTVIQSIPDLVGHGIHALAKAGAKRIALWSPMQTFTTREDVQHYQRLFRECFQTSLAEVGLPYLPELVQQNGHRATEPGSFTDVSYQRQGYETALAVFENRAASGGIELPDAIFSTDDMLTVGAIPALRRCGIEIRREIMEGAILMASHANVGSPVLLGYEDDLYLVENDPADVVEALFTKLEVLMSGKEPITQQTVVPGRLRLPETPTIK
jgi:DNA-binding LacI/PurR family transcriptional regulator